MRRLKEKKGRLRRKPRDREKKRGDRRGSGRRLKTEKDRRDKEE
jgi:hypothetical protein